MKVYVVVETYWDNTCNHGAFSTKELAAEYTQQMTPEFSSTSDVSIEEFEVDALVDWVK